MVEQITAVFTILGIINAAATAIVAGLEQLAGITPWTKDDVYVGRAKKFLSYTSLVLDKFSSWNLKK